MKSNFFSTYLERTWESCIGSLLNITLLAVTMTISTLAFATEKMELTYYSFFGDQCNGLTIKIQVDPNNETMSSL